MLAEATHWNVLSIGTVRLGECIRVLDSRRIRIEGKSDESKLTRSILWKVT